MKTNTLRKSWKSSKLAGNHPTKTWPLWLAPAIVGVATCVAFLPVLWNGFVEWDDYETLVDNPHYRGLGWRQLRWMFTTFHMGHYQPLSWVTLGLDYFFWGMNPFGYHLTSLMLHAATAVVFFYLVRHLLDLATGSAGEPMAVWVGAAVSALLFALHPLRVESVAWATERRDVLSALFYTLTILVYLYAWRAVKLRGRWYWVALALFLCAVLSKSITVTLPVILLILDIYPLRRLGGNNGWWSETARMVYWEKLPFAVLSAVASAVAFIALAQVENTASLDSLGVLDRLAISAYSLWFYFWKTLAPFKLLPLYEMASVVKLSNLSFMLSYVFVILATALGLVLRRRVPGVGAVAMAYLVTLLPVLGIFQNGPQIVADRYSYLSCMGWAVLAGGVLLYFLNGAAQKRRALTASATAMIITSILATLTWQQAAIWLNTGTLWNHVLKFDPKSSFAHYNLARFLAKQGEQAEAIAHYREALAIRPDDPDTHNNLGLLLAVRGDVEESLEEFQRAVQINPNYAKGFFNLGRVYSRQGELEKAVENYRQALNLNPNEAEIYFGLGNVLARLGQLEEASAHFQKAVEINPDVADAHMALARALAAQGKKEVAERHYQEALRLLQSQNKNPAKNK